MIGIIQRNCHIGKTNRFAVFCSRKDDVLHTGASQLFYLLLTKHPAHRIRDITFSTAVRTYNTGDSVMKLKYNFIGKGFKTVYLD